MCYQLAKQGTLDLDGRVRGRSTFSEMALQLPLQLDRWRKPQIRPSAAGMLKTRPMANSRHGPLYLLGEIFENVYGPNIHSDGTGRAFGWRTRDGQVTNTDVKVNGYGLGVSMDRYGRPVKAMPND